MNSIRSMPVIWLLALLLGLTGPSARADQVFTVTIDTHLLATDYAGPFGLDFELIGSNGNTVILGDFTYGGGAAGPGTPFLTGGASGDLGSTLALNDRSHFFSDFNQQFTPGSSLTFTVDTTLVPPPSGGIPDNFSMVIFSSYDPANGYNPYTGAGGTPIPTTDPTGDDTFFNFNVNGPGITTVNSYPSASGDVTITVTQAGVPEPSSGLIMLSGLMGMTVAICRRRRIGASQENRGG